MTEFNGILCVAMRFAKILHADLRHPRTASKIRFDRKWHNLKLALHTDDETKDSKEAQMKARGNPASSIQ